jgi:AcrR family transcriptional regulator
MRKGGVERLPKVVDAFVALLTGSLFKDDEREGPSGDASKGAAPRLPIPTPSEETALEERLALIALHRFAASGFGKVSLKEIAGLAGVTTGAIFHYFDSKASLYRAAGALGTRQFASSLSTSDIYAECSQRQRVNTYLNTLGESAVNLVDNHWIGVRVHIDARVYPPLVETRDEWGRELEQHYRLVASGRADMSCRGKSEPDQELVPALLNVLTLGAAWFTVRHGAEALKPALLGLQRLIKVAA